MLISKSGFHIQLLRSLASFFMQQAFIYQNAGEPGTKTALLPETAQLPVCINIGYLHDILYFFIVFYNRQTNTIKAFIVFTYQAFIQMSSPCNTRLMIASSLN